MVMLCGKTDKSDLPKFLNVINIDNWVAEEKFDGDRIRVLFKDGKISMHNRRYRDHTATFPELHSLKFDGHKHVLLDGEMCVMIGGISAFNEGIAFRTHCKNPARIASGMKTHPVVFVAFDLLELDGVDLRGTPLRERRRKLEALNIKHDCVEVAEQYKDIMPQWNRMQKESREGLILKDMNSLYKEGYRSFAWRKVKNIQEVDLKFTKYDVNTQGITVENTDGIRCLVGGRHQWAVRDLIDKKGVATLTINHLGQTKAGKFRQPTYNKVVVN